MIQGLPGQFQVGYSKKNHKLFVPTVGARGNLASSLARVDADTLQTEAFAELPVKKNDKGQYGYTSAYGVTVDDVDGTVWVTNTIDNSVAVYDQQTSQAHLDQRGCEERTIRTGLSTPARSG